MTTLYIMCGIPGSGKSSIVKNFPAGILSHKKYNIIESDKIRKEILIKRGFTHVVHQNFIADEILTKEEKQSIENKVWQEVDKNAKDILYAGKEDIIIDATNTEQHILQGWFNLAINHVYKPKVIVMSTPLDICIARNERRNQPVPVEVMEYMYNTFILSIGWLYMEHNEKIINSMHL